MTAKKPKTKARKGRPSKFTPKTQEAILELLRAGNFREVAAEGAGIDKRTFMRWMKAGRKKPSSPEGAFVTRVREAEREAEIAMVKAVVLGAAQDPKHAEWFLERKFPERWGRKDKSDVNLSGTALDGVAALLRMGHGTDTKEAKPEGPEAPEQGQDPAPKVSG